MIGLMIMNDVCLLVSVSPANAVEPIKMSFGLWTPGAKEKCINDIGSGYPRKRAVFSGGHTSKCQNLPAADFPTLCASCIVLQCFN